MCRRRSQPEHESAAIAMPERQVTDAGKTMQDFLTDDQGAASVDWVALTAAAGAICLAAIALLSAGELALGERIRATVEGVPVATVRIGGD